MKTFKQYIENTKANDKDNMNQAYFDIIESVSKEDSKKIKRFGSTLNSKHILNEMLIYFGYSKIEIPSKYDRLEQQLEYITEKTGILKRKIVLRDSWYKDTTMPLLCQYEDKQVMLIPTPKGEYNFVNPDTLISQKINSNMIEKFSREAYCFYKPFENKALNFLDLCKFILSLISTREIMSVIVISGLVLGMNLIFPYLNKIVFDQVIPSGTIEDIWAIAGLMIGISIATASFNLLKILNFSMIKDKVKVYLQGATWARLMNLPTGFFKKYSSSDVFTRTNSIIEIGEILSGETVGFAITAILSFIYIAQIGSFAPVLVGPAISISLVLIVFSISLSYISVKYQMKEIELNTKLSGFVFEIFSGISKIKTTAAQVRVFSKWADKYSKLTKAKYSPNVFIIMSNAIYAIIAIGGNMLIYFTVARHKIAPADFIGFNVAFSAFSVVLLQFHNIVIQIANIKSYYELAKPILQTLPENKGSVPKVNKLKGNIDINNVRFKYEGNDKLILDGIDISIKAGEYVAFVGTSGSGKSTLLRILLGFEKPLSGNVYYDDQDISSVDISSVRKNIGVVMQNGTLFADDIYANITICNPSLSFDEAWQIAKRAGLEEDINNMPMGMNTIISEGGGMSGGQKQRLMIARAFASNPSIIMFDEATSALDNISQQKIITSLEEFEATKIVIAHRLSTIINCDKIFVLDKGKIAEVGNYDELIKKEGLFYNMAKRQVV